MRELSIAEPLSRLGVFALTAMLRAYQLLLSPFIGPMCRFEPSCSEYALQAIERYGVFVGLWRGVRRLLRCHPFHPGGWDPVR